MPGAFFQKLYFRRINSWSDLTFIINLGLIRSLGLNGCTMHIYNLHTSHLFHSRRIITKALFWNAWFEKKKKYLQYPLKQKVSKFSIWIRIFFNINWHERKSGTLKLNAKIFDPVQSMVCSDAYYHLLQWALFLAQEIVYRTQLTLSIMIFSDLVCPQVLRLNCKWMQSNLFTIILKTNQNGFLL